MIWPESAILLHYLIMFHNIYKYIRININVSDSNTITKGETKANQEWILMQQQHFLT